MAGKAIKRSQKKSEIRPLNLTDVCILRLGVTSLNRRFLTFHWYIWAEVIVQMERQTVFINNIYVYVCILGQWDLSLDPTRISTHEKNSNDENGRSS